MIIWSGLGFLVLVFTFGACWLMNLALDQRFGEGILLVASLGDRRRAGDRRLPSSIICVRHSLTYDYDLGLNESPAKSSPLALPLRWRLWYVASLAGTRASSTFRTLPLEDLRMRRLFSLMAASLFACTLAVAGDPAKPANPVAVGKKAPKMQVS